jgi:hypothetical protein
MTLANRYLGVSLAAMLVVGTVACSGGGSPGSPTDPAGGSTPSTTTLPGGATVRGVVETGTAGAASAGELHALGAASGVRVTVVGTALATTTGTSGEFELRGVPAGRVQLRFEASGIDARLEIEGVTEGQSLNVNVHVSSSGAFLAETEDHRNETSLRGSVDAVSGGRLTVLGRTVQTDGLTEFLGRSNTRASLADVRVGQLVEVEGTNQADGTLYARKVRLEDSPENEAPQGAVNFVGSIQGLSPLTVAGRRVDTDGSTKVLDRKNAAIALSALKVNDKVEVEGTARADGSVLAKKIKLQD